MSIKLSAIHAKGMTSCVETKVAEGRTAKDRNTSDKPIK